MKYLSILFSLLFFISCTTQKDKELTIAVNSWIGYTPLFYAKEKNYLKNINIKLVPTVSLGESTELFSIAKVDMLTATQHEYNTLSRSFPTLIPVILMDRSNGGDMILSNRSIQELQESQNITVYLEVDSINNEMIQEFTKKYHLNANIMKYINQDQSQIQDITYTKDDAVIIVTYSPYNLKLIKKGFKELASTKDTDTLLVIDAIYMKKETFIENKTTVLKLKKIIDQSILEIQKNPYQAYQLVQSYLINISFEEFENSLKMIKWINIPDDELIHTLEKANYSKDNILR